MSELRQKVRIVCPLAQAAMRLGNFFREHGSADDDTATLSFRISVDISGLPMRLKLERLVIVTIQPHRLPADTTPRYKVQWASESSGPFPRFSGEFVVDRDGDDDTFSLNLSGEYAPPVGLVGPNFDVAVGNRISHATASDLLLRVKTVVEGEVRTDEALKGRPIVPL